MKYCSDTNESFFIAGSQPHKSAMRKNSGKGKKLHSFKKDDALLDELGKHRSSYKRAETKNLMRNQLRDIQIAF